MTLQPSPSVTLWREVDALGGVVSGSFTQGYAEALSEVLAILERRGFTEFADANPPQVQS